MRSKILVMIAVLIVGCTMSVKSQSDLTFYNLGEVTPQANMYNAVFFPDAKIFVSLPVLSGVSTNYNNSVSFNDLFEKVTIGGKDSLELNVNNFLSKLKEGDALSFDGMVSLLQVGFRLGKKGAVQVFANERYRSVLYYPTALMGYLANGNGAFVGQEVQEENLKVNGFYYREYGIGYSHELQVLGGKRLRVGGRFKYLQGIVEMHTQEGASASILTESNSLNVRIRTNNAVLNTAGFGSISNISQNSDYIISNGNTGFGADIGADLQINEKWHVALGVNDLGSITWAEDVSSYTLLQNDVTFGGLDLKNSDISGEAISDTLSQLFDYETSTDGYTSKLNTRIFVSGDYQVTKNGKVSATVLARNNFGEMDYTYGFGYTHQLGKVLTLSGTFSRVPTKGIGVGGGLAARFGPVQFYTSVDNFIGFVESDVRNMYNANVRFGVNLLFGRFTPTEKEKVEKEPRQKKVKVNLGPFPPEYELDHLEGDRGDSYRETARY